MACQVLGVYPLLTDILYLFDVFIERCAFKIILFHPVEWNMCWLIQSGCRIMWNKGIFLNLFADYYINSREKTFNVWLFRICKIVLVSFIHTYRQTNIIFIIRIEGFTRFFQCVDAFIIGFLWLGKVCCHYLLGDSRHLFPKFNSHHLQVFRFPIQLPDLGFASTDAPDRDILLLRTIIVELNFVLCPWKRIEHV